MWKLILGTVVILGSLLTLGTSLVTALGQGRDDPIITVVMQAGQEYYYRLIDYGHTISVERPFPIHTISDAYVMPGGQQIMLMTGQARFKTRLHFLNIQDRSSFTIPTELDMTTFEMQFGDDEITLLAREIAGVESQRNYRINLTDQTFEAVSLNPSNNVTFQQFGSFSTSPDGQWSATLSRADSGFHLYLNNQQITEEAHPIIDDLVWSQDSQYLVFGTRIDEMKTTGVYIVDTESGVVQQIAEHGQGMIWSPDGSHVVIQHSIARDTSWRDHLFLVDIDQPMQQIAYTDGVQFFGWQAPVWSEDSQYIAFPRNDGAWSLYTIRASDGSLRAITQEGNVIDYEFWR